MADLPKLSEIRDRAGWSTYTGDQGPLVAALDAVLALHAKTQVITSMTMVNGEPGRVVSQEARCLRCYSTGVWPGPYPCLTVRALAEHIDLEG